MLDKVVEIFSLPIMAYWFWLVILVMKPVPNIGQQPKYAGSWRVAMIHGLWKVATVQANDVQDNSKDSKST